MKGRFSIASRLILSPMAGISDLPYRMLNRRFGCELAFTEMVSAKALSFRNYKTIELLRTASEDQPLGVQLLGNKPDLMARAISILSEYANPVIIDINAACPVAKVTRRGEGAALLREPKIVEAVMKAAVQATDLPVSLKLRTGWDAASISAVEIAIRAEAAGAAAIFIHGRTQTQGYSGDVDYKTISAVKKAVSIPVIGNGNAFSGPHIKRMFDETGCDAVGIARGCLGNPWIFREAEQYLRDGNLPEPPHVDEIIGTMVLHLDLIIAADGEQNGVTKFRKFFAWYVKGLRNTRGVRTEAFSAVTREDMVRHIETLRDTKYRSSQGRRSDIRDIEQ